MLVSINWIYLSIKSPNVILYSPFHTLLLQQGILYFDDDLLGEEVSKSTVQLQHWSIQREVVVLSELSQLFLCFLNQFLILCML